MWYPLSDIFVNADEVNTRIQEKSTLKNKSSYLNLCFVENSRNNKKLYKFMSTIHKQIHGSMTKRMQSIFSVCTLFNLRKQATLRDVTTGFPRNDV